MVHPTAHFGVMPRAKYVVARTIGYLRRDGWMIESVPGQDVYYVQRAPQAKSDCAIVSKTAETATDEGETPE
jgi:hypothetical protein